MRQRVKAVAADKKPFQSDTERFILLGLLCVAALWTINRVFAPIDTGDARPDPPAVETASDVIPANVPLATGRESIDKIFVQSGCTVCHTIPGIRVAKGREGPPLELGTNARKRLADPAYRGHAATEWEYVQESILHPGAYVVAGYPDHVMPRWYGRKLSAAALEKMIRYLLRIEAVGE